MIGMKCSRWAWNILPFQKARELTEASKKMSKDLKNQHEVVPIGPKI